MKETHRTDILTVAVAAVAAAAMRRRPRLSADNGEASAEQRVRAHGDAIVARRRRRRRAHSDDLFRAQFADPRRGALLVHDSAAARIDLFHEAQQRAAVLREGVEDPFSVALSVLPLLTLSDPDLEERYILRHNLLPLLVHADSLCEALRHDDRLAISNGVLGPRARARVLGIVANADPARGNVLVDRAGREKSEG